MELLDFVIEAKLAGYASGMDSSRVSFEDGSKGFLFENSKLKYVDRFYGFNPFSGTEFVFKKDTGKAVWTMSYYGKVDAAGKEADDVYRFLCEALVKANREYPLRGPSWLKNNDYLYINNMNGSFERFHGKEIILKDSIKLYRLDYHGGIL